MFHTLSVLWTRIVQAVSPHTSLSTTNSRSSKPSFLIYTPTLNEKEDPPAQAKLKLDEVSSLEPPINLAAENAPAYDEGAPNCDDEDGIPAINDVESLKKRIIKTSKNKAKAPYTILLAGETGVGKSSLVELIANVLSGRDIDHYDFDILDQTHGQGGAQTNSTRLYEFTSKNGIVVRILDTPGLADTRGIQQDELHRQSIATQINEHIDSITAILILANGTVPRVTVGTQYALSTLHAILPKTMTSNIAFVLTHVSSVLHQNFSPKTLPDALQTAPRFLLSNPVALQRRYLRLKGDSSNTAKGWTALHRLAEADERDAMRTLVDLFDWLDGLEWQPTTEIITPKTPPAPEEGVRKQVDFYL